MAVGLALSGLSLADRLTGGNISKGIRGFASDIFSGPDPRSLPGGLGGTAPNSVISRQRFAGAGGGLRGAGGFQPVFARPGFVQVRNDQTGAVQFIPEANLPRLRAGFSVVPQQAGGVAPSPTAPQDPGTFSEQNPLVPVDEGAGAFPSPFSITTPAGVAAIEDGRVTFDSRTGDLVANRGQAFSRAADFLEQQAGKFNFGEIVQAGLEGFAQSRFRLEQAKNQAIGGLKDQLARREILGASFSNSLIEREEERFAGQGRELDIAEAEFRSNAVLQELQVQTELITRSKDLRIQAAQEDLKTVFGESAIAAEIGTTLAGILNDNLKLRLLVAAQEAQSIRAAKFGEQASIRTTEAQRAISRDQEDFAASIGIGGFLRSVFEKPVSDIISGLF